MLYQIQKGKNVFDTNQGLRLIPEFAILERDARVGDKWMRYVMLVADYKSPLKQHPIQKRKELAILDAGGGIQDRNHTTLDLRAREIVSGKNADIEAAIKKYLEIQYDEDREHLETISRQIYTIRSMVMVDRKDDQGKFVSPDVGEMKKLNDLLLSLPDLVAAKKKLAQIAEITEEIFIEETSQETKPLSLIDRISQEKEV